MTAGKTLHVTGATGVGYVSRQEIEQIWRILGNVRAGTSNVSVVTNPRGITISADAADGAYNGPHKGEIDPGNAAGIIVGADRAEADYYWDDRITVGLHYASKAAADTVDLSGIAADAWVYYAITKSGTAVSAPLAAGAGYPSQVAGTVYWILGRAVWDAGAAAVGSWHQSHHGVIHIPGRFA